MFVSEECGLDISIDAAQARLANLVAGDWLSAASQTAYDHGIDHLVRVGPFGGLPGVSRLVRVQFLDPLYRGDAMTVGMRWEAAGVGGSLFPVLDANITVTAGEDHQTRLIFMGSYRPPLGAIGAGLDRVLLHRVASLTISSLLTRVAGALEGAAEADAAAPPENGEPFPPECQPT